MRTPRSSLSAPTGPPRDRAVPYGVVSVVETPFDDKGCLDLSSSATLVSFLANTGVQWVMYPGFASEFYKIDAHERGVMLALLLDEARQHAGLKVVAGVTDHSTVMAERSAVTAVEAGASAINLLPPHFLGPSPQEVLLHVKTVLAAVQPIPVILQVAPAFTGSELSLDALGDLAEAHGNLRGLKVESVPPGPMITALKGAQSPLEVIIGYGGLHLPDALRRGATGVQPGCSFTELYVAMWDSWVAADPKACEEMHRRLLPYLTYWMTSVELMVAVEKTISHRRGFIASSHCRRPSRELDTEESRVIDRFLAEFGHELRTLRGPGG